MTEPKFNSERSFWRSLRSSNRRSAARRRDLTRGFRKLFPKGHRTSLREFVEMCALGVQKNLFGKRYQRYRGHFAFLSQIHPDAFSIIEKYGSDYVGGKWKKPPPMGEPRWKGCFVNAWKWAHGYAILLERHPERKDRTPMVYVEGIVHGSVVKPMLHAWNALGLNGATAMDWTFYAGSHWIRYRGIPLTIEEQKELLALTPVGTHIQLLFKKGVFTPKAKRRLIQILEKRRRTARRKK
jgi:hypothetical protein